MNNNDSLCQITYRDVFIIEHFLSLYRRSNLYIPSYDDENFNNLKNKLELLSYSLIDNYIVIESDYSLSIENIWFTSIVSQLGNNLYSVSLL